GQSIDVDAPPNIIDVVDEDDDIIDEEDPILYDLANSDDEDLVNLNIDDGVNMSADVARGHSGDGGGDDRPPPYQVLTGCGGCLVRQYGKKAALKERYWVPEEDGSYDLERIRRERPSHIFKADWDEQLAFWNDPKNLTRAAQNKQNWAKSKVDEMLRLHGLGSNTLTGVPYTEDEIMAIVRGGKQRGYIPGVGRVFPRQGTVIPPPSQSTHSADIARLKKREKLLTKQVNMFISGSGGCGDDEPGDDEDGGGEDEDDSEYLFLRMFRTCGPSSTFAPFVVVHLVVFLGDHLVSVAVVVAVLVGTPVGWPHTGTPVQCSEAGCSTVEDDTMNEDTPVGVASAVQEGITPSVVDMTVEMGKQYSLDDTIVLESFSSLSTPVTNTAGIAPGKSSYANITGKPNGKKVNVRTLFTPRKVTYPVVANYVRNTWGKYEIIRSMFSSPTELFSFQFSSMDGLDAMLENGPWFIRNNPLILKKWHPDANLLKEYVSTVPVCVKLHGVPVTAFSEDSLSAIATNLVVIELRADVKLKDNIFVTMPKTTREGHYTCNVRVEYGWKPPRCSSFKVFGHIHEECPKNTGAGEKKTMKKLSQTSRGVLIGPKMSFKPQKEYRPVLKKPNANSGGNKKKGVEPTIEVSNSNLFDVLNSVDNDVEFGTNGGTTNLVNNGDTSSGSSSMNIDNDGEFSSNTPIGVKIDKIKRHICEGKLRLLDNDGNPLVPTGIIESDSEVEVIFDETANLRISTSDKDGSDKGYGTNNLLE
nr:hypothetical protein [Tanacetum cinerariifolium]